MVDSKLINYSVGYLKNVISSNLYLGTGINLCRPATIPTMLTYKCNAKCLMCNHWRRKDHSEMTTVEWTRWLSQLKKWHRHAHVQFSGGEPFIRKDVVGIFEHCASIGLSYGITTNLGLTPHGGMQKFVGASPFNVNISLDGIKPETHDYSRGTRGLFVKVMENLESMLYEMKRQNKKIRIILKPTVLNVNIDELEGIVKFAKDKKLEGVNFQPLFKFGGSQWEDFWIRDIEKVEKVSRRLLDMKKEGYPVLSAESDIAGWKDYFKGATTDEVPRGRCLVGVRNFHVHPEGDVYLCPNINIWAGNLTKNSPEEIWHSDDAEKGRDIILKCKRLCLTTCQTKRSMKELYSAFRKMSKKKIEF
ncbi:MAG: radical SAM protein [Nitrospirae bacterium]|nr:radical SAM protein [Nitrospirota bacterium]